MKKSIIFFIIALILTAGPLIADISSVTVTPAAPTPLSNGNSYYLAAKQYTFVVQASDPLASTTADWDYINLYIENGANAISVHIDIDNSLGGGINAVTVTSGDSSVVPGVINSSTGYSNITYTIPITIAWDTDEFAALPTSAVRAVVREVNGAPSTMNDTVTFNFGLCSSIRALNLIQTGVAADGRVNPWHNGFTVSGSIVYNVIGVGAGDTVDSIADAGAGEITTTSLILNPDNIVTDTDADELGGVSYTVGPLYMSTTGTPLGDHTWTVRATMSTAPGPGWNEISGNSLLLNSNQIQITDIRFINGGGVNPYDTPPNPYYRSVNVPNTQVQITAWLQDNSPSLGVDRSMRGNTTITLSDGTNTTSIPILSGQTIGTANIFYPTPATDGSTQLFSYTVTEVTGGGYGGDTTPNGQIGAGRISQTATYTPEIYWDRNDPPGNNNAPGAGETPFTTWVTSSQTASSFTLEWTPLTAAGPPYDADFDTYRIYYKESTDPTWLIVDRTTPDYGIGGPSDNYHMDQITTGSVTISGLQPFTQYDYLITAVDVFGQEVEHPIPDPTDISDALYFNAPLSPDGYGQITTYPAGIEATITDGITTYNDTTFEMPPDANPVAANRPLRKSAIKVSLYIVTTGDQPDAVNIILAQDNGTGSAGSDLVSGGGLVPVTTVLYERIACSKTAPNTWTTQVSSEDQFFNFGSFCRFIVETIKNNTPSYSDANSETETILTANPNDFEYTFAITRPANFAPWPVRILNNVITGSNPVAYPSYYLTDDAHVTITVHDIKGRTVATLTDNSFRRGGQNIKENGWRGTNKARRKLGVGLYYIHIQAKRASDGRIILNETKKVVIAK